MFTIQLNPMSHPFTLPDNINEKLMLLVQGLGLGC